MLSTVFYLDIFLFSIALPADPEGYGYRVVAQGKQQVLRKLQLHSFGSPTQAFFNQV